VALIHRLPNAPADFRQEPNIDHELHCKFASIMLADERTIKEGLAVETDEESGDEAATDSDVSSVLSDPPLGDCEPPFTHAPRGWPLKKRKRNGEN
jgi:hypothetical protein